SLLHTTITRLIVHSEKLAIRKDSGRDNPACRAPLHPILVTRALASLRDRIAGLVLDPAPRKQDWRALVDLIRHLGHDPNWRRRPSVLDTMQGLTAPPARRRRERARPPNASPVTI